MLLKSRAEGTAVQQQPCSSEKTRVVLDDAHLRSRVVTHDRLYGPSVREVEQRWKKSAEAS